MYNYYVIPIFLSNIFNNLGYKAINTFNGTIRYSIKTSANSGNIEENKKLNL